MNMRNSLIPLTCLMIVSALAALIFTRPALSQESKEVALIPVDSQVLVQRKKAVADAYRDKGKLVAFLDCGSQMESTEAGGVKLTWIPGSAYLFPATVEGIPATQASVAFDVSRVVVDICGLHTKQKYEIGLTWWDYDNGARTQMVTVGSVDGRNVHMAIPAIRLPNFKDDRQKPAEKRFRLPVNLARDGKMRLVVQQVTGANAVISELWVAQLD